MLFGISGIVWKKLEPLFSNTRCYEGRTKLEVKKILPALRKLFLGQKNMAEVETYQHLKLQMAEAVLHRDRQKAIRKTADWQDISAKRSPGQWWTSTCPDLQFSPPDSPGSAEGISMLHDCSGKTGTHKSNFKCLLVLQEYPLSPTALPVENADSRA